MHTSKWQVDAVRRLLMAGATSRLDRMLSKLQPADLAALFSELSPGEIKVLVDELFSTARAGMTLRELPRDILPSILELIEDNRIAQILERIETDDATVFLHALDEERSSPILDLVPEPRQQELRWQLLYGEETAGSVMTPKVLTVDPATNAEQAIDRIRTHGQEFEATSYMYVVDEDEHLLGVVPLRRLIAASADQEMRDLMVADPIAVQVTADREEAAALVSRYNLLSLPVVDENLHLLGIITVDDVIDIIHQEATEDMYRMAGLSEGDRVFTPIGGSIVKRSPWMLLNLATALLAAVVVGLFQDSIIKVVSLAVFMPVVAGMGGNGGTQALTVMTRAIILGDVAFTRVTYALLKEFAIGATMGAWAGLLAAGIQFLWKGNAFLGLVLFLALIINMMVGCLTGAAVPLLLRAIGKDPALAAGVIVTTVTDVVGFFSFLGLATILMEHLV